MPETLLDKIWAAHRVAPLGEAGDLLYIDLHLLHEINTPQAFDRLRASARTVRRPELTLATEDHNTPTTSVAALETDPLLRRQVDLLRGNCAQFGIPLHRLGSPGQGIAHVIAPEQGLVLPGSTLVCCDSHTTTHGAFGALAFGIGTSQVEHVLATQTLPMPAFKAMRITVRNRLPPHVSAKDLALAVVHRLGTGGGVGHVIEYAGEAIRALSMEGRMTLCNMSVEAGASAGLVAVDECTIAYLRRAYAAQERPLTEHEVARWRACVSDPGAEFARELEIDAATLVPRVSWGTNPAQSIGFGELVPDSADYADPAERLAAVKALDYMRLTPGQALGQIGIDKAFVGSCTNGRIEDLRAAAAVLAGRRVHPGVHMVVVPGSMRVRDQAVGEGLDRVFRAAGADFRDLAGCSMCVGLNADRMTAGQRSVSTNNRNFEGRQGPGALTHIASPAVAAASAVLGRIASPAELPHPALHA